MWDAFILRHMMKKMLGVLGGMGPLATVDFLQKLIEETPARVDHPGDRLFRAADS
jgi:hypothetical protein